MSHVLVLGAGVSGMAAARLARSRGLSVTIYDRNPGPDPIVEGFAVAFGEWDHLLLRGIDLVITSPGFSERSAPIVETLESGVPLVGEIEYAWSHLKSPVIAVTGTNGKTTVTEVTSAMLESSGLQAPAVGNIGDPLSDHAGEIHDVLVVEVSSFQLRFSDTFHPVAAAITNVALDHLDWHGSAYSYREAKARIFANQTGDDLLVYVSDDPGATHMVTAARSQLYPVSGLSLPPGGGGVDGDVIRVIGAAVDIRMLHSSDPIHVSNIACAAALAIRLGATPEGVAAAATAYRPGEHRRRVVAESRGVVWVDDSKATNPHAALASIRSFGPVVLIAGGLDKGLDVMPLADEPNVRVLIGIGDAGPALVERAGSKGRLAERLETAVAIAGREAVAGDTVLLAPGCASFDQFESYAERGRRYVDLVVELTGGGSP